MTLRQRGWFITLEGIEGAGKSTVAASVIEALRASGLTVCGTREPGGTPLAERVRSVVLDHGTEVIPSEIETLLMFAARGIHLENKIRPALARGEIVVCDRFTDATRAYQGAGRGVASALIESLVHTVHRDLEPDLTLLLDLPVPLGLARARVRNGDADRIEAESAAFFERVRACYLELARAQPERFAVIDASQPVGAVCEAAISAALNRLRDSA